MFPAVRFYFLRLLALTLLKLRFLFSQGSIHPRFKREVGRRLAVALHSKSSGPTLTSITVDVTKKMLSMKLDAKHLAPGEGVVVQPFNTNMSAWVGHRSYPDSSSLMVCTSAMGPMMANASTCGCRMWDYIRVPNPKDPTSHGHDIAWWHCLEGGEKDLWRASTDSLQREARRRAALPGTAEDTLELGWVPNANPFVQIWLAAPLRVGKFTSDDALVADLSGLNASSTSKVHAVRYGWPLGDDTCCPTMTIQNALEVCRPASCPIISAQTFLPMNPFFATCDEETGECACPAPQVC